MFFGLALALTKSLLAFEFSFPLMHGLIFVIEHTTEANILFTVSTRFVTTVSSVNCYHSCQAFFTLGFNICLGPLSFSFISKYLHIITVS